MRDKDQHMLFEAYEMMYEMPVSPGESWDDPSADVAKKFKGLVLPKRKDDVRTLLSKRGLKDEESQAKAIDAMKNFLAQYDDSHYTGDIKEFRRDALEHMQAATGLKRTQAGYIIRILQNAITHLNVLSVKDDEVRIQDVEKLDNTEEILDTPAEDPEDVTTDTPTITAPKLNKFNLQSTYTIDIVAISEGLPRIEKELIEYIQEGMTGEEILFTLKNSIFFRNPASAGGLDSDINMLKRMIASWLKSGILKQEEGSEADAKKEIEDMGVGQQNPHAAGDYLKDIGANVPTADPYSGEISSF
jgi:hypothetical protein